MDYATDTVLTRLPEPIRPRAPLFPSLRWGTCFRRIPHLLNLARACLSGKLQRTDTERRHVAYLDALL